MALATKEDYEKRHGVASDPIRLQQLIDDACSLVLDAAEPQLIELVEDDEVELIGDGSKVLILEQRPVVDVSSISIDGSAVSAATYSVRPNGVLRRASGCWPNGSTITATYTHGYAATPPWIVQLICAMVQRVLRPAASSGVVQQTTLGQSVGYGGGVALAAAGTSLWLTEAEVERLRKPGLR